MERLLLDGGRKLVDIFMPFIVPLTGRYKEFIMEEAPMETCRADRMHRAPRPVRKTLYLVRHGEAVHNILEKEAQKRAGAEAETLGHQKGSDAYKAMVEMARKAVLHDTTLVDPPLSHLGKTQALSLREKFQQLHSEPFQLPEPTQVFVSPLHRTLQTVALIFPEHPNIRVSELVQERHTGLACDEPTCHRETQHPPSFSHINFDNFLKAKYMSKDDKTDTSPGGGESAPACEVPELPAEQAPVTDSPKRSHTNGVLLQKPPLENAEQLRQRTAMLGVLLRSTEDTTVCVVTHKGYLRELERGPFRQPQATEFGTGEIRVYEVSVTADGSMEATLCYCKDMEHSLRMPSSQCRVGV